MIWHAHRWLCACAEHVEQLAYLRAEGELVIEINTTGWLAAVLLQHDLSKQNAQITLKISHIVIPANLCD